MDGVLVDFGHQVKNIMNDPKISKELKDRPDLIKDIFLDPPPIDGAIDAINKLKESKKYELLERKYLSAKGINVALERQLMFRNQQVELRKAKSSSSSSSSRITM